jgi:hypothetical protein
VADSGGRSHEKIISGWGTRNLRVMVFLLKNFAGNDASMKRMLQLVAVVLVMVCDWPLTRADETAASNQLPIPAAVQNAVRSVVPEMEISRAEWDKEKYTIKLKNTKEDVLLTVSADGAIRSVERELWHAKIPAKVQAAVQKAFPDGKCGEAIKLTRTDVSYMVAVDRDGRKREVKVTTDGKLLEVEKE